MFGKVENGAETMIYYGSLGEQKQYVSAYVEGTAPDVRRYPVSITVTAGVEVEVSYPAEAWMTAEEVAAYFNGTLKPELEKSLGRPDQNAQRGSRGPQRRPERQAGRHQGGGPAERDQSHRRGRGHLHHRDG